MKLYGELLAPMQLLKQVRDWRSYVTALHQCDIWWSNRRSWSVLGEQRSWRGTIEVLHDVIRREDWSELGECDRLRLLGLTSGEDLALLGRMRRIAFNTVFGANLGTIQTIVRNIAKAKDAAFPQLAFDAYEALRDVDGVGEGIADEVAYACQTGPFHIVKQCFEGSSGGFRRPRAHHLGET